MAWHARGSWWRRADSGERRGGAREEFNQFETSLGPLGELAKWRV
jgi:hypothetical protein